MTAPVERPRNPFVRSAAGGRTLSALQLPLFLTAPPKGAGVLTTTGRRSGKRRRKCVRVIRDGNRAYLVMLGPALLGVPKEDAVAAWLHNIRADPRVHLRIRGGTVTGTAREVTADELATARRIYTTTINNFDYTECWFHSAGRPDRAKIERLHSNWFDTGIPVVIEID